MSRFSFRKFDPRSKRGDEQGLAACKSFGWIVIPCSNVARHGEVEVKERHETKKRKAEESVSVAVRALVP